MFPLEEDSIVRMKYVILCQVFSEKKKKKIGKIWNVFFFG